jgi:hypothetical protein
MSQSMEYEAKLLRMKAKLRLQELQQQSKVYKESPMLFAALTAAMNVDGRLEKQMGRLKKSLAVFDTKPELSASDKIRREFIIYQTEMIQKRAYAAQTEAKRRMALLLSLDTPQKQKEEKEKCAADIHYWWDNWAWTVDPRDPVLYAVPFIKFPFQDEFINDLEEVTYITQEDLIAEKSRDQGISWIVLVWMFFHWTFPEEGQMEHFLCASMKADDVDKLNVPSTLLEKVRVELRLQPDFLLPAGFKMTEHASHMRILNPENGSIIAGTSANGETGRSGRWRAILLDEHAATKDAEASATSSSQSTNTRIFVSTHRGKLTHFFQLTISEMRKRTFHWFLHPWKDERWYAAQTIKMNKAQLAQEVDIDPEFAQTGRVYPEYDERRHVITWREFADEVPNAFDPITGRIRIPLNWYLKRGNDWASGAGESANITLWFATAPEGTITLRTKQDISGSVFIFREYVAPPYATVRDSARFKHAVQAPDQEQARMTDQLFSHERATERITFNAEYELPYRAWTTDPAGGIARVREYLQVEGMDIHPFRPQFQGTPKLFLLAVHDEAECFFDKGANRWVVRAGTTPAGMKRTRAEFMSYHYKENDDNKPEKVFDDAMDVIRSVASSGFPPRALMSKKEKFEESLPDSLKAVTIQANVDPETQAALYLARINYIAENKNAYNKDTTSRYKRIVGSMKKPRGMYGNFRD